MREHDVAMNDGALLHVVEHEGTGPAVLLLHDLDCSGAYWDAVVARLRALDPRLRLVVPDLRGHGRSGVGEAPSRKRLLKDLAHLLRALDITDPVVCGHGWGGDLALAFDGADSVVAVNPLLGRAPAAFEGDVQRPAGMLGAADADALRAAIVGATTAKPLRRGRRDAPLLLVYALEADGNALAGSEVLEHATEVVSLQGASRHLPLEMPNAVAALLLPWIEEAA